jgi:hypothetical protein
VRLAAGVYCAGRPLRMYENDSLVGERFALVLYAPTLVTEVSEVRDRSPRDIADVMQGPPEGKRFGRAQNYLDIRDEYLHERLDIHVHWTLRSEGNTDAEHVCTVFKRAVLQRNGRAKRALDIEQRVARHGCGEKCPVLINDVEPVENPQRVKLWPAFVGLQSVESCLESLPAYLADFASPCLSKPLSVGVDRELGCLIGRAVQLYEGPSQVVERAAEVMDAISDHAWPVRRRALGYLNAVEALRSLRIRFAPNSVGLARLEAPDFGIQGVQVMFTTIELCPAPLKRVAHVS